MNPSQTESKNLPAGFKILPSNTGHMEIVYAPSRKGLVFFVFWLSFWTYFCITMTHAYLYVQTTAAFKSPPVLAVILFWLVEIFVIASIIHTILPRRFVIAPEYMVIEKRFRKNIRIDRHSISAVKQLGHESEGSPLYCWSLEVRSGEQKDILISQQPYASSFWLGRLIASWAGVEFTPLWDPASEKPQ